MKKIIFIMMMVVLGMLSSISSASSNAIINNTAVLTVYGLPAGASFVWRVAPNYTTITTPITGYTTKIPIYISNATNSTYHRAVPWQYQGAGTTVAYNGVTYTMLTSNGGTCATQIINSNGIGNYCEFYVYLNSSLWTSNESKELKASNASLSNAIITIKSISNITNQVGYGTLQNSTSYIAAGENYRYAKDNNGSITFISSNISKTPSPISLCVSGACTSAAGNFSVYPVVMPFGSHKGFWNLSVIFSALPKINNRMQYNYSILLSNGTYLVPKTITNSSSFSMKQDYWIPKNISAKVIFDAGGNANYTSIDPSGLVIPSGIKCYINMTIQNTATSATAAGLQIMMPFNALNNQALANCPALQKNLQNIEWFWNNGTIATTWIEGNVLNESSVILNKTSNVIVWLKMIPSIAGATTDTNVITLGIGSIGTNLQSSTVDGIAPQLSSSYAAYDNGGKVFDFYDGFAGTTLNTTKWNKAAGSVVVNNGVTLTYTTAAGTIYSVPTFNPSIYAMDSYATSNQLDTAGGSVWRVGWYGNAGSANPLHAIGTYIANNECDLMNYNGAEAGTLISSCIASAYHVWSVYASATVAYGSMDYGTANSISTDFTLDTTATVALDANNNNDQITAYWARARLQPPSGVMPLVTYASPTVIVPNTPILTTSPVLTAIFDVGQIIKLTASFGSGVPPYKFTYEAANSVGAKTVINQTVVTNSSTKNTINFPIIANMVANSPIVFNVIVTDSGVPTTVNSIYSFSATINPALIDSWTAANTSIDEGQIQVLTASTDSSGTSPYTYNYLVYNAIGSLVDNELITNSLTTNTFVFTQNPAWKTGTFTANIIITDSATSPETITNTLTYSTSPALAIITNTISNSIADQGQQELITFGISGGTPNYNYNVIVSNSVNGNIIFSQINKQLSSTSNTFLFTLPYTSNALGTLDVSFNAIDDATTNEIVTSSNTLIVNPALPLVTLYPSDSFSQGVQSNITVVSRPAGDKVSFFINTNLLESNSTKSFTMSLQSFSPGAYTYNAHDLVSNFWTNGTFNIASTGGNGGGGGGGGGGGFSIPITTTNNSSIVITSPPVKTTCQSAANNQFLALMVSFFTASITSYRGSTLSFVNSTNNSQNGLATFSIPIWIVILAVLILITIIFYYRSNKTGKKSLDYRIPATMAAILLLVYLALPVIISCNLG